MGVLLLTTPLQGVIRVQAKMSDNVDSMSNKDRNAKYFNTLASFMCILHPILDNDPLSFN